jgi:hypothetical protein
VIHGIRQAQHGEGRDQRPVAGHQGSQRDCGGAQQQTAGQDGARPDTVDQETGRRLQGCRHNIKGRQGKADGGVADAVLRPHQPEDGGQEQDIEMAHEMRRADQADHLRITPPRRTRSLHCLHRLLSVPGVPAASS